MGPLTTRVDAFLARHTTIHPSEKVDAIGSYPMGDAEEWMNEEMTPLFLSLFLSLSEHLNSICGLLPDHVPADLCLFAFTICEICNLLRQ